jgi:hypothetical protein
VKPDRFLDVLMTVRFYNLALGVARARGGAGSPHHSQAVRQWTIRF